MKIAIIGYSGSGKSTLAKILGSKLGVPVLHLDRVQWLPGWQERDVEESRRIVAEFMKQEKWVIDGNYKNFYREERLESADEIIFLNFNRVSCLLRAYKRLLKYRGMTRDDMGEGCQEKIDWEFFWWIMKNGRKKATRERYKQICKQYSNKVCIIKNQRQLDLYMAKYE